MLSSNRRACSGPWSRRRSELDKVLEEEVLPKYQGTFGTMWKEMEEFRSSERGSVPFISIRPAHAMRIARYCYLPNDLRQQGQPHD